MKCPYCSVPMEDHWAIKAKTYYGSYFLYLFCKDGENLSQSEVDGVKSEVDHKLLDKGK